ncbi:MAG: HPr family phosphocarrier protein [Gammaproteobacteria bacterium]|nr:HPr family phosphocarrier protein [Gammaproteobacteria bacterium]MCP5415838.1 HPr family phosphocarrier protein [Chromatiaceae bacterium]
MIERDIQIINKLGLHARAAAKFVTLASQYRSKVELILKGQRINGKSIMGVMMLAASQGTELILVTEGEDEVAAIDALDQLIKNRFGEEE